jgi:IPT/TIG domain-containing protein
MRGSWLVLVACVACGKVNNNPGDGPPPPPDDTPGSDAAAAPTITALTPDWGSSAGVTVVTINGTGFSAAGLTLKFGAVDATPTVVNDTTLTVTAPPNLVKPLKVTVTTANGSGTSAMDFRYLAPLYAADGAAGVAKNLYIIDPATGADTPIGLIGFAVTGMAISPDGVLFGATGGAAAAGGKPSLIVIDPYSGAGLLIGQLKDTAGALAGCSDLVFDGNVLRGWHGKQLATINTTTAIATLAAPTLANVSGGGNSLGEVGGQLFVSPAKANGILFKVNKMTGVATAGPTLNGPAQSMGAMTRVGPTLLGSCNFIGTTATAKLFSINTATGAMQLRGQLPQNIDAIAGIP